MASTFRSRRFGADLRALREAAKLTTETVSTEMGFSRPKLTRIETGEVRIAKNDLKALLHMYGVDDEERVNAYLLRAREVTKRGWWQAFQDAIPRTYADFIALESEAMVIKNWEPILIPGLLQTEAYTRAVIDANPAIMPPTEVDELIRVLRERQAILNREQPPRFWAIMGESAVRQTVGGVKVMGQQLAHLGKLTEHQHVVLQVLPHCVGAHAGLTGAFVVFGLPRDPDVVCVENMTGTLYMDRPGERQGYGEAFDHLRAAALNPADSLAFIRRAAEHMQE